MKKTTKLMALVLALVLVLSLSACAGKGAGINGTWKYTMDFKKAMESAGAMDELGEGMEELGDAFAKMFDGLSMVMVLELKEDNTYSFYVDEASAKAALEGMMSKMGEILPTMMSELFGMSEEEFNAAMAASGMTMDDLVAEATSEMDTEEMLKDLEKSSSKGTYRYEAGKLYLTAEGATEDPNKFMTVELNGNELKITALNGVEALDQYKELLPMVFTR